MIVAEEKLVKAPAYREIVSSLKPEQMLTLHGATWQDYEEIIDSLGESGFARVSYSNGTLKIMTLSVKHEIYAELIKRMVDYYSRIKRFRVSFTGSTTLKNAMAKKGAEPDAEFYVTNALRIKGIKHLDLDKIPPPDIVVEIDVFHPSDDKFEIYAAFGVPEFWLYDEKILKIYRLEDQNYKEVDASVELPRLSAEILTGFLNRSRAEDQFELLSEFENHLQTEK